MNWAAHFQRRSRLADEPSFGAEPPDVIKQVQAAINARGYTPPLVVDGNAGPKTETAVRWLQQQLGITADGLIGPQTVGALGLPVPPIAVTNGPAIPGLRQSVVNAFPSFSGKFEGQALPYMYTDSKGLVTTGTGNLIDPVSVALTLPWKNPDGSLASKDQVISAFNTVKSAYPGVQSTASQKLTTIRLDKGALDSLVYKTLKNNHAYLEGKYGEWYAQLPADAQMVLHSLAWAWGPGFANVWGGNGNAFINALSTGDYQGASDAMTAASAHEESINPGIIPRNAANRQLLANAAAIAQNPQADPDTLYYPGDVITAGIRIAKKASKLYLVVAIPAVLTLLGYEYWKGRHGH